MEFTAFDAIQIESRRSDMTATTVFYCLCVIEILHSVSRPPFSWDCGLIYFVVLIRICINVPNLSPTQPFFVSQSERKCHVSQWMNAYLDAKYQRINFFRFLFGYMKDLGNTGISFDKTQSVAQVI